MSNLEKINYHGWQNCIRLSNNLVELIITTDVGPRIIHFGFVGGENELAALPDTLGKIGGSEWHPYGGHRLWHAPEVNPRTYLPDNNPVTVEDRGEFIRTIQQTEQETGIQKEMDISLAPDAAQVRIVHRLISHGLWPIQMAVWSITVMAQEGVAIMPLPPRGPHHANLQPTAGIAIWPYTNMSDPRWKWGYKYVMLRQDPSNEDLQKCGIMTPEGWIAYARNNHLFVKLAPYISGANYPDLGCTIEAYTDANILEVEALGPLTNVLPGSSVEHTEWWHLFDGVPMPTSEDDVDANVLQKVEGVKATLFN